MRPGLSAGAKSPRKECGGRKKRWRAARPDAAQALGELTAFAKRDGAELTAAMGAAFAAIRGRCEEKCTYRPSLLGWAMLGMFLFRRGSVNALDAQRPVGSAHPSWLREVSGLTPEAGAEAPCGELLRHWAGRLDAEVAAELLSTAFETLVLRQKRLDVGRIDDCILVAVDGTGRDKCRKGTRENGKRRRVALVASVLASWGKVPIAFEEVDEYDWMLDKADCERKAFDRLALRLKKRFPKLRICLVGDALYACRSLFLTCERNNWRFIATFKEGSWKDVSRNVDALLALERANHGPYRPTGWQAHRRDAAGGRVKTDGKVRWVGNVDFGARGGAKDGRWLLTVVACREISPMPYDGRFVTDLPCPDAAAASRIATCGRKRWWIESQNQTQKHRGYGLKHNYCNKSNASKVLFVFLLLATLLWEVFYKLGLRHWQPGTRKTSEESWVKMMWALLIAGSQQWREVKGRNLKRA